MTIAERSNEQKMRLKVFQLAKYRLYAWFLSACSFVVLNLIQQN